MKEDFKDLDLAIMDGAKQFATLSASISKTNKILASKNWIIFSRFISGTPLWQFQNRIKATVMLLNEVQQKGEKRRTQEAKEIQNFAKIAKMRRKAKDLQQSLLDIEKATGDERKKLVDALKDTSEQYEGLTMKLGSEEAATKKLIELMNERVDRADKLQEKAEKAADDFKQEQEQVAMQNLETMAALEAVTSGLNGLVGGYSKSINAARDMNIVSEAQYESLLQTQKQMELLIGPIEMIISVTKIMNAVMLMNPMILITIAIIALIAGLILLEHKYGTLTKAVEDMNDVFDHWRGIISDVKDQIDGLLSRADGITDLGDRITGLGSYLGF